MNGERIEVVVVGAGFAGIAAALAARSAGHEVVVLERADRPGGTWRENTYPGVACDVPAHLYGLADHLDPGWSAEFAPGAEIQSYLEGIVQRTGLSDILRLGSPLLAAAWDDDERAWRIDMGGDRPTQLLAEVLVLACGRLTEPAIPLLPGLDSFPGAMFHSARWDHSVPLDGAKIAVVGSGASAVQIVPALVSAGSQVVVFQRTPAWIVPRGGRAYTAAEQARLASHPEELAALRERLHREGEARFASRSGSTDAAAEASGIALAHLAAQVVDPALRARLTPHYAFGCKRVLLSDDFYPALASGAAQLEPSALAGVHGRELVSDRGVLHSDFDAIVFATGFETARQPYAGLIRGEDDVLLEQYWGEGMTSFGSVVVPGFPNLFVLNGPNASLGHTSSVLMLEHQAAYVVRSLARRPGQGGVLRTRPEAEGDYTRLIDEKAAGTPWLTGGCRNWYVDARSRRLTLMWPGTATEYGEFLAAADGSEFAEAVPGEPAGGARLVTGSAPRSLSERSETKRADAPADTVPVGWTLIIPVKRFTVGKSRLRGHTDHPSDRHAELARAIALDTIAAAAACARVERIVVVTDEDLTDHLPSTAVIVPEGATARPNPAVLEGITRLGAASVRAALVGDLPALRPADLDEALALAENIDRTVTADAAGTGSTLVTARAGVPWQSAFGEGSFARHVALGCVPLPIDARSTLRRDVDTPDDLAEADRLGLGEWTRSLRETAPA